MRAPLFDVGPAWLPDWDLSVQIDEVVAQEGDGRLDTLTEALRALPGVERAIHEDREVWHLRGQELDRAAVEAVVDTWVRQGGAR